MDETKMVFIIALALENKGWVRTHRRGFRRVIPRRPRVEHVRVGRVAARVDRRGDSHLQTRGGKDKRENRRVVR